MTDDEKIDFLKELRADLGSSTPQAASAKSVKREIRDMLSGASLISGVILYIFCAFLSYTSGASGWLLAGVIAFALLTFTGNRIVRFATITSGEAGFATSAIYLLLPYLINLTVFLACLALLMGEWFLIVYLLVPAVTFWRIERLQTEGGRTRRGM